MLAQTPGRNGSSRQVAGRAGPAMAPADTLAGVIEVVGAAITFARNREIYGDGERADYVYKVVSGAVRTYKVLADGRRQIGAFYLPGDVFGLEVGDEHALAAEAVTESKVLVVKRSALIGLASRDSGIARELWALMSRELARGQARILLLVKTAQERVVGFLLEMAERRQTVDAVELPMSRQDIADYLGLTTETVSRTLTSLENDAAIALPNSRRILLRNPSALRRMIV